MTLLEYLKAHKIRLEDFAGRIDRATSTVSRIARGETAARHDTMMAIVKATKGQVGYADLIATNNAAAGDSTSKNAG